MTLRIRNRTYHLPPTWYRMGFCDRAGYLAAQGIPYRDAFRLVCGRRSKKFKPPAPQEIFKEMERRISA